MSIPLSPDGLATIREGIGKQQSKAVTDFRECNKDHVDTTGGTILESLGPSHILFSSTEPSLPHDTDLIEGSEKMVKVRKIAVGPATPSYKGFSETEVKNQLAMNKGLKAQDHSGKDRKPMCISLKLQDMHIEAIGNWLTVEDTDVKPKKMSRVIVSTQRQPKQKQQKNKEIITTSSWRIGQELILRVLGPMKRRSGKHKEHLHVEANCDDSELPTEKRPETQSVDDHLGLGIVGATSAEIQHHKALTEQARSLCIDFHLGADQCGIGTHSHREKHYKSPVKRKALKSSETEKQQKFSAKQRHYDQEQIQKYIQQQKADRLRQKKEEDMRVKEEKKARKRQLEELYHKQKQVSHVPVIIAMKENLRCLPTTDQMQNVSVGDFPKQHPFSTNRPRFLVCSDTENKENIKRDHSMDISDSSSTLTGDGSADRDGSPKSSLRHTKVDVGVTSYTRPAVNSKDILMANNQKYFENNTRKFSQALQEKLVDEPHLLVIKGTSNINNRYGSDQDNYSNDPNIYNDGLTRSRAERIQAIKDTAATLRNRIKEEAKKIQSHAATTKNEYGATSQPSVTWNEISSGDASKDGEFMSLYEHVTWANDDFTVFKSNLPGTHNQHQNFGTQPSAQTVLTHNAKLPSETTNSDIEEEATITETSTFSEITLTDKSDNKKMADKTIGLKKIDFHVDSLTGSNRSSTIQQSSFSLPTHPTPAKASNSCDAPDGLNVFSVYSRRLVRPGREPMSKKKLPTSLLLKPDMHQYSPTQASASSLIPKGNINYSQKPTPLSISRSPVAGVSQVESQNSESLHNESQVDSEDKTSGRLTSTSEKYVHGHQSLPTSVKTVSKANDSASLAVESGMDEAISQAEVASRVERTTTSDTAPAGAPRLSPNSLERKFFMEFHNLESKELSLKQLTSVDRSRGVAMAQQETVSLAQMLKAKQPGYDYQMKAIQLKAQTETSKHLEDARRRASKAASNATELIAKVRGEGVFIINKPTKKTEATKSTADCDAVKFSSEAQAFGLPDTNKLAASASTTSAGLGSKWQQTTSSKQSSEKAMDQDDLESIGSIDDFSISESMTEDEREEKSFRLILPSESHWKKSRHKHSDNESFTSEASSTKALDHDIHSLFRNNSFDKFTEDMVQQFMKEEDKHVKHQASLLHLKESALLEKTAAELQWLEQQKQRIRNKGADDSYPQIKKLQRDVKIKFQKEQEIIRRLREENRAAAKERQRKLYEEISKNLVKENASKVHMSCSSEVHTEAEIDKTSDVEKRTRNHKSNSEINTELKSVTRKAQQDSQTLETYKKTHLDEKYLTQRQSHLMDRRKNAKELIEWKKMLDATEDRVFKLETKALKVLETKDKDIKKDNRAPPQSMSTMNETEVSCKKDNDTTKNSSIKTVSITQDHDSTIIPEHISIIAHDPNAHDDSMYFSIREDIRTASIGDSLPEYSHQRLMNHTSNLKRHDHCGSESSVLDQPSNAEQSKKTNDSSNDTLTRSYERETFKDTAIGTSVSKNTSMGQLTPKSPLDKLKKMKSHLLPRSPKGLFSTSNPFKNSESESEDSISHTESQSEFSDFEGRILALNEELRWRKAEADKLKRERKRKKWELMKSNEESLKNQIEAYDNQINRLKVELDKEMSNKPPKITVRPQIKQPKVSPPKVASKKTETLTPPIKKSNDVADCSVPETSLFLPAATQDDKDRAHETLSTMSKSSTTASLQKISEGTDSVMSHSDKPRPTHKQHPKSLQDLVSSETSMAEEIKENISAASEASEEKSPVIRIDLQSKTTEDIYDVTLSYTEDLNTDHTLTVHDKLPLSARSHISTVHDKLPLSTRSQVSMTEPITAQHNKLPSSTKSHLSDIEHVPYLSRSEKNDEPKSENLPTVSAESECYVRHRIVKEPAEKENNIFIKNRSELDEESTDDKSCSLVESSRCSSGRSEQSFPSYYQTEHESSESEKSPAHVQDTCTNQLRQTIVEKTNQTGLISASFFDIDDLLGMPDEDDLTPVASPRDLLQEASGSESERSKTSTFCDPLIEFNIGDRVSVTGPRRKRVTGTLLFKGIVQFAMGVWAGVELDKPEGRHNGIEDGVQYFTCKTNHGLIVPALDLLPEMEGQLAKSSVETVDDNNEMTDSFENGSNVDDLMNFINQADSNVQQFDLSPGPQKVLNKARNVDKMVTLADNITDHLLESVIKENMNCVSNNAQKQIDKKGLPPPVAPKPKIKRKEMETVVTNGHIDDMGDFSQSTPQESGKLQHIDISNDFAGDLMNDAINRMLELNKTRRYSANDQSCDSGTFEDTEDGHRELSASLSDKIYGALDEADEDDKMNQEDTSIGPESPMPGLHSSRESRKPVVDSGTFDGEFEDETWLQGDEVPRASDANAGTQSGTPRCGQQVSAKEFVYIVPHEEKEVNDVVAAAVDEYWEQRRHGEPLVHLQPSESFYSSKEIGSDLISNSRRVFKRLLFDLTGEVISNIYKQDYDSPVAWHKTKWKSGNFHKGAAPPTTVQVLKPVVQKAVIDILGLNGVRKVAEKNTSSIRKKKDLVDTILVQELKEEEPEWINYEEDEIAVKMQVTETLFENLLKDTVQTMNKIFRRKQTILQQKHAAK